MKFLFLRDGEMNCNIIIIIVIFDVLINCSIEEEESNGMSKKKREEDYDIIKKQTDMMWTYRNFLAEESVERKEIEYLLKSNNYHLAKGKNEVSISFHTTMIPL